MAAASVVITLVNVMRSDGHMRQISEIERRVIRIAIERYGNMSEVARRLGIGRSTLYRKMAEYGITTAA